MEIRPWVVGAFGVVLGVVIGYAYADDKTDRVEQQLSAAKSEFSGSQKQLSDQVAKLETQLSEAAKKAESAAAELITLKGASAEKTKTIDGHVAKISELQDAQKVSAKRFEETTLELERARADADRLKLQVEEQQKVIKDQQTRIEELERRPVAAPSN